MVSILCSEIPYFLFFAGGMFLIWFAFKKVGQNNSGITIRIKLLSFFSGITLAISQTIRPTTMPFLFIFSLLLILGTSYFTLQGTEIKTRRRVFMTIRLFIPVWIGFLLISLFIYKISSYGFTLQPWQNGLWNMYVGFNSESKGTWNSEDAKWIGALGDKYDWDAEKINRDLKPIVFERVKRNCLKNVRILPRKLGHLLNVKDILYWSLGQSRLASKVWIYKVSDYLYWVNMFVLMISVGAWALWWTKRVLSKEELFTFCTIGSMLGYLGLHGYLFEVQPRYINHLWMMMFWCYPLSQQVIGDFFRKIFWRRQS